MSHQHVIFVCTTCGKDSRERDRQTPGDRLLAQLKIEQLQIQNSQNLQSESSLENQSALLTLQPVQCLGVCEKSCAVAFAAAGKRTYLFGNLPAEADQVVATATAVMDCARLYVSQSEGVLSYFERPELLKTRVLARIPPVPVMPAAKVGNGVTGNGVTGNGLVGNGVVGVPVAGGAGCS